MILFSSFTHIYVFMLFLYLGLCSGLIFFISCFLLFKLKTFFLKPKSCSNNLKIEDNENKENYDNIEDATLGKDNNLEVANSGLKKDNSLLQSNNATTIKNKTKKTNLFIRLFRFLHFTGLKKQNKLMQNSNDIKETKQIQNKKEQKNKANKKQTKNKKQRFIFFKKVKNKLSFFNKKILKLFQKSKKPIINVSVMAIKILIVFALFIVCYFINLKLNYGEIRIVFVLIFVAGFLLSKRLLNLLANFLTSFYNYLRRKFKNNKKIKL